MFGWLRKLFSGSTPSWRGVRLAGGDYDWDARWNEIGVRMPVIRARYDAAQTTIENRRYWKNADGLSANAANSPDVRRTLRNRTRYEVANNTHAKNILLSLANYTVGTGPRLQMLTSDDKSNKAIEREWSRWALSIDLPGKLRTMRVAKAEDGEAFAAYITRPNRQSPVQLDLRLYEADQIATPELILSPNQLDGIEPDEHGQPAFYHLLKQHPGDGYYMPFGSTSYSRVPAAQMLHYFRQDRPGQVRGVPELTPALPLFALLRRYILAVLTASEQAAIFSGVLETSMPPAADESIEQGAGEAYPLPLGTSIEPERGMFTAVPGGWKLNQLKAEHPTAAFAEFHDKILGDIGCVLQLPFCVVACNSSGYNYASGRLDYQSYDLSLKIERAVMEQAILDRVFAAWLDEAIRIENYLPQTVRKIDAEFDHQWFWDGREHVDPSREANAQATRLRNGTTNLSHEYAKIGRDYDTEITQWRREKMKLFNDLVTDGLMRQEAMQVVFQTQPIAAVSDVQPDTNRDEG